MAGAPPSLAAGLPSQRLTAAPAGMMLAVNPADGMAYYTMQPQPHTMVPVVATHPSMVSECPGAVRVPARVAPPNLARGTAPGHGDSLPPLLHGRSAIRSPAPSNV